MKAKLLHGVSRRILVLAGGFLIALLVSASLLLASHIRSRRDDAVYDELIAIANSTPDPASNVSMPVFNAGSYVDTRQTQAPEQKLVYDKTQPVAQPQLAPVSDQEQDDSSTEMATTDPHAEPTASPEPDFIRVQDYSWMQKNFSALLSINPDCIGWLQIEGTRINYPVVYSKDSQKYLAIGFDGKENRNGTIFATGKGGTTARNITLYGHSMSNKDAMFHQLTYYSRWNFYKEHKEILYSTPNGNYIYRVFAVFPVDIVGRSFNYTQMNFLNETDFENFVAETMTYSVIVTGEIVPYGAHLLTLSTCETNSVRFVVMAYR